MATIASLLVRLGADTSGFERNMTAAQQRMRDVGRAATTYISLPLAAAGIAATKFALDFNRSMANVATLIPNNTARVNELKGTVQALAIETGKSTGDLAEGLYQVVSAFGDTADSVEVLNISARAATAGISTTLDAINLTSAVTKAYGDTSATAVQRVADLAFQAVKLGQTTFPELAQSIQQVTSISRQMNVSQEELFAVMGTLTGVTGDASTVATQLRSALVSIFAPSAALADALDAAGIASGEMLVQQRGLQGAFEFVAQASRDTGVPLQEFIGRVEGIQAVLQLTGAQSDVYRDKLAAMGVATGAMNEAFREQAEGINKVGFALNQAKQRFIVIAQKIGDILLPQVVKLIDKVSELAQAFLSMSDTSKTATVQMGALAAAAGLVLVGLNAIVAHPVIATITLIGVALVGTLRQFGLMEEAIAVLITAFESIKFTVKVVFSWLRHIVEGTLRTLYAPMEALAKLVTGDFAGAWDSLKGVMQTWKNAADGLAKDTAKAYGSAAKAITNAWKDASAATSTAPTAAAPTLAAVNTAPLQTLRDAMGQVELGAFRVKDAFGQVATTIKDYLRPEVENLTLSMQIQQDMLARVSADNAAWAQSWETAGSRIGLITSELAMGFGNFAETFHRLALRMIADIVAVIAKALVLRTVMAVVPGADEVFGAKSLGGLIVKGAKSLFGFAEGGVAMKPMVARVAEREPEAIIPLSKLGRAGGDTQQTIIVQIGDEVVARAAARGLPRELRLQGVSA